VLLQFKTPDLNQVAAVCVDDVGRDRPNAVAKHLAVFTKLVLKPSIHEHSGLPSNPTLISLCPIYQITEESADFACSCFKAQMAASKLSDTLESALEQKVALGSNSLPPHAAA
jgi:hypothetical protein